MQYDFSLNAGGGQQIDATGEYVKYKSGLGAIRVKFSTGGYVDLTPGQGIRVQKRFNSINLTERTGNANQGVLVVGDVDFQDDTIVGTVSIVDGGKNNTLSKNCFLATVDAGTVASNCNAGLLINNSGSGKNLIVESITGSSGNVTSISFHMLALSPALNVHGQNKYAAVSGGVASVAFVESNYGAIGVFGTPFQKAVVSNSSPMVRKFAEPLIIPPGMSVAVVNNTVAQTVLVDFEWREDPV